MVVDTSEWSTRFRPERKGSIAAGGPELRPSSGLAAEAGNPSEFAANVTDGNRSWIGGQSKQASDLGRKSAARTRVENYAVRSETCRLAAVIGGFTAILACFTSSCVFRKQKCRPQNSGPSDRQFRPHPAHVSQVITPHRTDAHHNPRTPAQKRDGQLELRVGLRLTRGLKLQRHSVTAPFPQSLPSYQRWLRVVLATACWSAFVSPARCVILLISGRTI